MFLYLELLILGEEEEERAEEEDLKAWPPTRPPDLAADAGSTDPSVNTPAANATSANFANLFSFLLNAYSVPIVRKIITILPWKI